MIALDEDTGQLLKYRQMHNHPKYAAIWNQSFSKKMGTLCQGVWKGPSGQGQRIAGTDTFFIMDYENIPRYCHKDITYTSVVCEV